MLRASITALLISINALSNPNWEEDAYIPESGRSNPYEIISSELPEQIRLGKTHALIYPVEPTGILIPFHPLRKLLNRFAWDPMKITFLRSYGIRENLSNPNEFWQWLGMHSYPEKNEKGIYSVPYPTHSKPAYPMGVTLRETRDGVGVTFSCAACHSANLFGKRVLGMTNRFPRANRFFYRSKRMIQKVPPWAFRFVMGTTAGEKRLYAQARENSQFVDAREPMALGLDTSLSHTALSLARRAPDDIATKDPYYARHPDDEPLAKFPSDSKPSVWWNLKYKNRWLSDGSVVSGNPIYTNLLWNEIGRGTDLVKLEEWLDTNPEVIRSLTTAVFASEPPRFSDFFPMSSHHVERAKRGEKLFLQSCAKCHGVYEKAWSSPSEEARSPEALSETIRVSYHESTPVIDVGTDPLRFQAMESLAKRLNPLAISIRKNILIRPQEGYVPPPLVGIWARWPYFHNNSAPNLCAVLTQGEERPKKYFAGEAEDPETDFDRHCNGYPLGSKTPEKWKRNKEALFNSEIPGLSRLGHDEGIFLQQGKEIFLPEQKLDLIAFLQTL